MVIGKIHCDGGVDVKKLTSILAGLLVATGLQAQTRTVAASAHPTKDRALAAAEKLQAHDRFIEPFTHSDGSVWYRVLLPTNKTQENDLIAHLYAEHGIADAHPFEKTEHGYGRVPILQLIHEAGERYYPQEDEGGKRRMYSLVLPMASRESSFGRNMVSHAGARGLLQVMPATAEDIDVRIKKRLRAFTHYRDVVGEHYPLDLTRAQRGELMERNTALNIDRSVAYLRYLDDRCEGKIDCITGSYNGGHGNWQRTTGETGDYKRKIAKQVAEHGDRYIQQILDAAR